MFTQAISIEDRYDERPDELKYISLSQFAKRFTKGKKSTYSGEEDLFEEDTDVVIPEEGNSDETFVCSDSQDIEADQIIAFNPEHRHNLKRYYKCGGAILRLRKPLVLRFHKYKQLSDPHQYYYSQLCLFHPHSVDDQKFWESDLDKCMNAYNQAKSSIDYVKSKVMNYQEKVENAQSKAQEEFDNCVGDLLDANKEQQDDDCREEGTTAPDTFMALDSDDMALKVVYLPTEMMVSIRRLNCTILIIFVLKLEIWTQIKDL